MLQEIQLSKLFICMEKQMSLWKWNPIICVNWKVWNSMIRSTRWNDKKRMPFWSKNPTLSSRCVWFILSEDFISSWSFITSCSHFLWDFILTSAFSYKRITSSIVFLEASLTYSLWRNYVPYTIRRPFWRAK